MFYALWWTRRVPQWRDLVTKSNRRESGTIIETKSHDVLWATTNILHLTSRLPLTHITIRIFRNDGAICALLVRTSSKLYNLRSSQYFTSLSHTHELQQPYCQYYRESRIILELFAISSRIEVRISSGYALFHGLVTQNNVILYNTALTCSCICLPGFHVGHAHSLIAIAPTLDSVPRNLFRELCPLADHYDTEMAPKKDEKKAVGPPRSHVLIQGQVH